MTTAGDLKIVFNELACGDDQRRKEAAHAIAVYIVSLEKRINKLEQPKLIPNEHFKVGGTD